MRNPPPPSFIPSFRGRLAQTDAGEGAGWSCRFSYFGCSLLREWCRASPRNHGCVLSAGRERDGGHGGSDVRIEYEFWGRRRHLRPEPITLGSANVRCKRLMYHQRFGKSHHEQVPPPLSTSHAGLQSPRATMQKLVLRPPGR